MLLAIRWPLHAVKIVGRVLLARAMKTTSATDVHHVIFSMLPTVGCRPVALGVEARYLAASVIYATLPTDAHQAVLCMLLAISRFLHTLEIIARLLLA